MAIEIKYNIRRTDDRTTINAITIVLWCHIKFKWGIFKNIWCITTWYKCVFVCVCVCVCVCVPTKKKRKRKAMTLDNIPFVLNSKTMEGWVN